MTAHATANAQLLASKKKSYVVHEISAHATIGLDNVAYKLSRSSHGKGFSGGVVANYAYNFNTSVAIVSGMGFISYYSGMKMSAGYSETYTAKDESGEEFLMKYTLTEEYREKQNIVLFYIPVMARYTMDFPFIGNSSIKYFVTGGLKLGIPFVASASISPVAATTAGYYGYEDRWYGGEDLPALPEHGFTAQYLGDRSRSRIKLGIAPLLSLETGVRIPVGYKNDMLAGFYVDYCFANVDRSNKQHLIEYQSLVPMYFNYNSIMNTGAVKRITLFNVGLKVGIVF
jgi:hypothetical protein